MKKAILFVVLATLWLSTSTTAQLKKIKGRVTEKNGGAPLPGATVKVEGTDQTIQTDSFGNFVISSARLTGILVISYTGYQTKKVAFNPEQTELNVQMETEDRGLDEVVVIGYGKTTKRFNTGSVSSISAREIEQQPVTNVLSALSGRMPGVFVQTTNGLPGGNINIQIRGKGSIAAGTNPLYIVDGVPFDGVALNSNSSITLNNIAGPTSPLNSINPSDIASITVLKDADATSIYGSRGSNGVILITTKQAHTGDALLNINLRHGITKISQRPELLDLNDYLALRREAYRNDNKTPSADPLSPNYAPDLTVWSQTANTDWIKYFFGNSAKATNLQGRLSGGTGQTSFSLSGNYNREEAVIPGTNLFQRGGYNAQLLYRSRNNKTKVTVNNQYNRQSNQLSNLSKSLGGYNLAPNYPLYLSDGTLNWYSGTNPIADMKARSNTQTNNWITSISLGYEILPRMTFTTTAGLTNTTFEQLLINPSSSLAPGAVNNTQFGNSSSNTLIIEPQLDYSLKIKEASISFLMGGTMQNRSNKTQLINASNFRVEGLMEDLGSAGAIDSRSSSAVQYKFVSVFGRLNYKLKDTYIINGTIRRDGSSRFGPGNRFGNFGSIGIGWIFSNLNFIAEKASFLDFGKLRASYGSTGNDQIGDYQYLSTYNSPGSAIYQDIATIRPTRITNENFHWETTYKTDLGMELSFLKERLSLNIDYFVSRSQDQLVAYNIPQITGFPTYQANLPAVIKNSGWEFTAKADYITKSKFKWSGNFNLSILKNELKSFENFTNSGYAEVYQLGYDVSRIYGYQFLSMDETTGRPGYAGRDGNSSLTPYYNFTLGKSSPEFFGGIANNFSYASFELSVFAQFVGQKSFGSLINNPGAFPSNNFRFVRNRWSATNPTSNIPAATTNYDFYYGQSSLNIFNTSYLRIKNVHLGYEFSKALLDKMKLGKLRIYAEAQNLFTWWDKNAAVLDPESGGLFAGSARNFPTLKSIVFGIQLTF